MKFNHDAEKTTDGVVGHKMDDKKVKKYLKEITKDPKSSFGGTKKTQTMEYIYDAKDDPEKLLAITILLVHGMEAIGVMTSLEKAAKEQMKGMKIEEDMPEEMKAAIREANGDGTSVDDKVAEIEDVDDEFERLRKKYK